MLLLFAFLSVLCFLSLLQFVARLRRRFYSLCLRASTAAMQSTASTQIIITHKADGRR
jgi:hypothetical protein